MRKKNLSLIGVILLISLFFLQSCQSKPEVKVLERYFHAVRMGDRTTMGTMALEPISPEYSAWEITATSEETVEPFGLPELNSKELELKKQVEESVIITMNAKDEVDDALFEMENARTREARRAAQRKVDDLQKKYEEIRERHNQLQVDLSSAQDRSAREEKVTNFSLGAGDVPNIRELSGDVHTKEVDIKVTLVSGEVMNYKCILKRYNLRDETLNLARHGMWKILRFEALD
ncbi:MAG: hypothetical protein JSV46_10735 [Candidatus Aminicenantes bacterium]|nr:MAG: hypothetical protein JSV46_10735 [Candidatus Aminicenantes bacterium]